MDQETERRELVNYYLSFSRGEGMAKMRERSEHNFLNALISVLHISGNPVTEQRSYVLLVGFFCSYLML